MSKKILALILALFLLLPLTACGKKDGEEAPDHMKSVTVKGDPFRLYVPTGWSSNTTSGISGAYYAGNETIIVSARYYTPADPAMTLDDYVTFCANSYAATLKGFAITERAPAVLGGKDAVKLSFTALKNDKEMTCFQITTLHEGDMISLHGYCPKALYEGLSADFDWIVKEFVLREKTDANGIEVVDSKTPEGMEIASADELEYRLYVPKAWICDAESGVSEAYYPESGKPNVTLTSYSPSVSISVQDYFIQCENEYRAALPNYERVDGPLARTVADRTAYTYVYRSVVDGAEFRVMQTLFAYNGMIYSLTYTSLADQYDAHLSDVEAILSAFTFR